MSKIAVKIVSLNYWFLHQIKLMVQRKILETDFGTRKFSSLYQVFGRSAVNQFNKQSKFVSLRQAKTVYLRYFFSGEFTLYKTCTIFPFDNVKRHWMLSALSNPCDNWKINWSPTFFLSRRIFAIFCSRDKTTLWEDAAETRSADQGSSSSDSEFANSKSWEKSSAPFLVIFWFLISFFGWIA